MKGDADPSSTGGVPSAELGKPEAGPLRREGDRRVYDQAKMGFSPLPVRLPRLKYASIARGLMAADIAGRTMFAAAAVASSYDFLGDDGAFAAWCATRAAACVVAIEMTCSSYLFGRLAMRARLRDEYDAVADACVHDLGLSVWLWSVLSGGLAFIVRRALFAHPTLFLLFTIELVCAGFIEFLYDGAAASEDVRLPPFCMKKHDVGRRPGYFGRRVCQLITSTFARMSITVAILFGFMSAMSYLFIWCLLTHDAIESSRELVWLFVVVSVQSVPVLYATFIEWGWGIIELISDWNRIKQSLSCYNTGFYDEVRRLSGASHARTRPRSSSERRGDPKDMGLNTCRVAPTDRSNSTTPRLASCAPRRRARSRASAPGSDRAGRSRSSCRRICRMRPRSASR